MNNNGIKLFFGIFFSIFIIVGSGLLIFGFVQLAQFKSAKEINATIISVECDYENREMEVSFGFESNGEYITTNAHYNDWKYNSDGRLPYYEGLQTKIHINSKNQIVIYGKTEIIVTVGGGLFFLFGIGFLYFFVLKRSNSFDMACNYENAMIRPEDLSDDTQKYEATADELSKLPKYNAKRMVGESKIWKNRIFDRLQTFTVVENITFSLILVGLIVLFWTVFKLGAFGILCGLFTFAFGGLLLKAMYGIYIKILVKLGKFNDKKLAVVKICAFESEGSFQINDLSRTHTVFKKFRVVATIDGKRSVGYVFGNVPPPQGCVLKVLIRPHRMGRFIIDNT